MKQILGLRPAPRTLVALTVLGLLATVVASHEAPREPVEAVAAPTARETDAAPRALPSERTTTASLDLDLDKLRRPAHEGQVAELFAARAQAQATQPGGGNGNAGAPGAPPGPPALPFQYLGKLIEAGKLRVFLSKEGHLYTVAAGQTLENLYKVERVSEEAVTFTYLPMGTSQTLAIPARS